MVRLTPWCVDNLDGVVMLSEECGRLSGQCGETVWSILEGCLDDVGEHV